MENLNEELDNLEVWENENQEIDETPEEQDNSHNNKETRYKEQLKGSREEAERLRNLVIDREVKAAEKDARSLLELHDTDPKLANEVAKRFGYDDYEEAKSEIDKNISLIDLVCKPFTRRNSYVNVLKNKFYNVCSWQRNIQIRLCLCKLNRLCLKLFIIKSLFCIEFRICILSVKLFSVLFKRIPKHTNKLLSIYPFCFIYRW